MDSAERDEISHAFLVLRLGLSSFILDRDAANVRAMLDVAEERALGKHPKPYTGPTLVSDRPSGARRPRDSGKL